MYTTFDVTVNGKLIYRTDTTLGGTLEQAHKRALEVALHYASRNSQDVPVVKRTIHE